MSSIQTQTVISPSSSTPWLSIGDVHTKPLETLGTTDSYKQSEVTPSMGTIFEDLNLTEILHSPDGDAKIRDLAIIVSRRGFCIFPKQTDLSVSDHKLLVRKLGQLTVRPYTSDLWIHPVNHTKLPDGTLDGEIMSPSRDPKKLYTREGGYSKGSEKNQSRADGWHIDGSFENVTPDYTTLHMTLTPNCGGDTMFASAYEAYDLLSAPMARMLEGLKATFMPWNHKPENIVDRLWSGTRGVPENFGPELRASHPCIRTNPVTGWKSLFAFGHHLRQIEGLGDEENKFMCEFLQRLITENHQIQARVKWSPDDLIIWDNRAVYHVPPPQSPFWRGVEYDANLCFVASARRTTTVAAAYDVRTEFVGVARRLTLTRDLLGVGTPWAFSRAIPRGCDLSVVWIILRFLRVESHLSFYSSMLSPNSFHYPVYTSFRAYPLFCHLTTVIIFLQLKLDLVSTCIIELESTSLQLYPRKICSMPAFFILLPCC
jgi:alpha-ketoglutarate-dependent taurine dioxygenase